MSIVIYYNCYQLYLITSCCSEHLVQCNKIFKCNTKAGIMRGHTSYVILHFTLLALLQMLQLPSVPPILTFTSVHKRSAFLEKKNAHTDITWNLWIMGYEFLLDVLCALFSAKLDVLNGFCFHIQTTPRGAPSLAGRSEKINTAIITEQRHMGHVWHDKPQMDISRSPCVCVCVGMFGCMFVSLWCELVCVLECKHDLCFTSARASALLWAAVYQFILCIRIYIGCKSI